MVTTNSSHCRHRRHSSGKSRQKRVVEEVWTETLVKFVRKHKTLAMILRTSVTEASPTRQRLGSWIAARFAGVGLLEPLPELRGQTVL